MSKDKNKEIKDIAKEAIEQSAKYDHWFKCKRCGSHVNIPYSHCVGCITSMAFELTWFKYPLDKPFKSGWYQTIYKKHFESIKGSFQNPYSYTYFDYAEGKFIGVPLDYDLLWRSMGEFPCEKIKERDGDGT